MHKCNRHLMVDHSSVCICYFTRESGETAYTVNYARERELEVVNVAGNWRIFISWKNMICFALNFLV